VVTTAAAFGVDFLLLPTVFALADGHLLFFAAPDVAELLEAPALAVEPESLSACATADPLARAAPTPSVIAPAPSHA
jgi:hypothetical protein